MNIIIAVAYLIIAILFARILVWLNAKYLSYKGMEWEDGDSVMVLILSTFWCISLPIVLIISLSVGIRKKWTGTILPFKKWFDRDLGR